MFMRNFELSIPFFDDASDFGPIFIGRALKFKSLIDGIRDHRGRSARQDLNAFNLNQFGLDDFQYTGSNKGNESFGINGIARGSNEDVIGCVVLFIKDAPTFGTRFSQGIVIFKVIMQQ